MVVTDMTRRGFEGVALVPDEGAGGTLYVAFQSGLRSDADDLTRIGAVDIASGVWRFFGYPLEVLQSGEASGLSDIAHLGDRRFALIERDGRTWHDEL
mgnify:FL=1